MNFKEITSKQNHFVRYALSLKDKKTRNKEHSCLVEGEKILRDLARRDHPLRYFFIGRSSLEKSPGVSEAISKQASYSFQVPDTLMRLLSTTESPAGFLAVSETPIRHLYELEPARGDCYLLLDNIQDPGNVGTIFRSCAAFGIKGLFLYGNCADPFNPKTVRASSGQTLVTPFWNIGGIEDLHEIQSAGMRFFGTSLSSSDPLTGFSFPTPLTVCMGNESKGISPELQAMAEKTVRIEISEETDSLNVSVASSIIAYEWYKNNMK